MSNGISQTVIKAIAANRDCYSLFCEEENLSISTVLPVLFEIMDNLKASDEDFHTLKEFKHTVTQSIQRWNLSDLSPILGLCTVLSTLSFLMKVQV